MLIPCHKSCIKVEGLRLRADDDVINRVLLHVYIIYNGAKLTVLYFHNEFVNVSTKLT